VFRLLPVRARRGVVHTLSPDYTLGAICLIERSDGALLLVRQSYRKRWGIPGGLVKRGEAPEVAVAREVREETGLVVTLVGEPAVVVEPRVRRIDLIFRATIAPGADASAEPTSPEIVETRWFPVDELPELQHETAHALVAMARSARAPQAIALPADLRASGT
jgi:ADP-ribose pyrophosphatase YjhB (NUDIX family)